jgi:Holliday junction resolvasome RuvABC endonuclease subunit
MRILTLDQSTRTGWAFGVERSQDKYLFGSFRMPKRDDIGERLVIFRDGLVELIETHAPDLVAYETPFFPVGNQAQAKPGKGAAFSVKTIKFLHNLEGVLIETTARYSLPTEHFPSSSWRVTALGYGRMPASAPEGENFKKLMMARARQLGYAVKDDNEGDAIGLLLHMLHGAPAAERAQGDLLSRVAGL